MTTDIRGSGETGEVAVKRLMLTAGAAAHRELKLGEALASRELSNVVQVLDYGQDAETDRYFLIMPICEYSLEDFLKQNGPLEWSEAQRVIRDIIDGLIEVGDIVHRDLKPGNVLWHNGRWKIADFGIAKFVEDSTSLQTVKSSLTPQYAAPEQWLQERPSPATDIYALACIIYRMVSGSPPFIGDFDEVKQGHLTGSPAPLPIEDARANGIVRTMLRKTHAARPSLTRCKTVLCETGLQEAGKPIQALAKVGFQIASQKADEEARQLAERAEIEAIQRQGDEAEDEIIGILSRILETISNSADSATFPYPQAPSIDLGPARLSFATPANPLSIKLLRSGWTVLAYTEVELTCQFERIRLSEEDNYVISSALVYARRAKNEDYRWMEVSFWAIQQSSWRQPIALSPEDSNFDVALSNTLGKFEIAFGPTPIDAENEQSFQDRWVSLFTRAAGGKLHPPRQMPPPASFYEG